MTINSVSCKLSSNRAFTPFSGGLQFKSRHSGGLQFLIGTMVPWYSALWYLPVYLAGTNSLQKHSTQLPCTVRMYCCYIGVHIVHNGIPNTT